MKIEPTQQIVIKWAEPEQHINCRGCRSRPGWEEQAQISPQRPTIVCSEKAKKKKRMPYITHILGEKYYVY